MRYIIIIRAISIILMLHQFQSFVIASTQDTLTILVNDNSAFAFDLYKELRNANGNIFFSPYSISSALAMTYAGTRENTEKQMAATLHFSLSQEQLHPTFAKLAKKLNEIKLKSNIRLSVANSLWPQQDYKFLTEYMWLLKRHYGVSVSMVNYKCCWDSTRIKINSWVEEQTQNKIKDLIKPGILDSLTRLVLVNAIYFLGDWAKPFNIDHTKVDTFFVSSEKYVFTPMMRQKNRFRYAELDSFQILELPYIGNDLSMLIMLPKENDGINSLEISFNSENLKKWETFLTNQKVIVHLPKFKISAQFMLKDKLISMGMVDAFDQFKANFAGMIGIHDSLYINAVIHKAFIDVNEKGTEAAASSAVAVFEPTSVEPPSPIFRVDHPFLVLIRENHTGSILFLGKVSDPTEKCQ